MNKKKMVTIAIAAALVVAIGATTAAASWSRLTQLNNYFDEMKDAFRIPEEVPIMNDPEVYGKEIGANVITSTDDDTEAVTSDTGDKCYIPPAPGTAKITTISSTGRSIFATIEFNAEGWDIPFELPEDAAHDAAYTFEWTETNFHWSTGRFEFVSREGDIFTYVFSRDNIYALPEDEIVLTLQRFGYVNSDKGFVTLNDIDVEVRLPVDEISVMGSLKSKNSVDIMGIEHTAELSAYEFLVWCNYDDLISGGILDENGYPLSDGLSGQYNDVFYKGTMEFHMTDGTVFIDHLFTNEFSASHLIGGKSGLRYADTGECADVYSFEVPLDISQIDYVVLNGYRFDFAPAE